MFTLENTEGYTQRVLDFHNEAFEAYFKNRTEELRKDYEQKYFNEFMCWGEDATS